MILKKDVKTINQWMDCVERENGFTIVNAKFKHDYSLLYTRLRKQACILYFMVVDLGIKYVAKMMYSAKNQAHFCGAVIKNLEDKKVDKEFIKMFQKNVNQINRRLETISRITKEDIHLTEYEPFFESEEFNKVKDDIDFGEMGNMAREWNKAHEDIVQEHLKKVQPEIDRHNKFLEEKRAKIKAEKEAEKQAKKEQRDYENEIINNRKKNRKKYERLERSFERYYSGRA